MRHTTHWSVFLNLIATALFAADPPQTRPATAPTDIENPFVINDVPLSERPAMPINDLVRFRLADDFLVTETTLSPRPSQLQRVEGMTQPIQVVVTHRGAVQPLYAPTFLQLTCTHGQSPSPMRTTLATASNHFSLSRDIITADAEMSIHFIQSTLPTMVDTAATLHIQTITASGADDKRALSAENFAAFIRRYPAETAQYLRPMLETFGPQPQIFAVDDNLAFSVFPEAFAAPADIRRQIDDLVKELGDDSYPTRQSAGQKLEQMGVPAAAALSAIDRKTLQPEQAARIDAIIARIKPRFTIDPPRLRHDPSFLLDCLVSENLALQQAAHKQLQSVIGRPIQFTPGHPSPQHINAVYALRAELLSPTTRPKS